MKKKLANVLTLLLLACSFSLVSCVDNEKNLFDGDQLKQIYEETFPVKNIDLDGNWTLSQKVTTHVSVNGDLGVDYTIQIFDANPLNAESSAKLLAEGKANNRTAFDVAIDCAKTLEKVFVARVDQYGRYLVQPVAIENGAVTAHFGDKVSTRAVSRAASSIIPTMEAPYTADFISGKKASATEIQAGWDLAAPSNWGYGAYPVFSESERWFKIPVGTLNSNFYVSGIHSGGATAVKVIVPQGSTWVIENYKEFSNITEIIVENGGKIEITQNGILTLSNNSSLTVLFGGSIVGKEIKITNGSGKIKNYNAGNINCTTFDFNGGAGEFYNYGTLQLDKYAASSEGTVLVNHGTFEAVEINGNNNTGIKNGCYLKAKTLQFGSLALGNTSETVCEKLTNNGPSNNIEMEAQSMLTCTSSASLYRTITGPIEGKALLRINTIEATSGLAQHDAAIIQNNIICEIADQTSNGENSEWSPFDWLVNKGLQNSATYANPDKAEFILPADGDCIKEGYNSDKAPDNVNIEYQVYSYAFEDNYPQAGDYDFNDIVLNVTLPASTNQVKELKYTIDLRAVGAVRQLGAGLRIAGIDKSNVEGVSFGAGAAQRTTSLDRSTIFENAAYEANGSELVIPLFGDAHAVYGNAGTQRPMINTGNVPTDVYSLEVTITLKNAISTPNPTENLDFFIAYQNVGQKRTEIHLNNFAKATENGQLADKAVLDIIKAINNTWALCVPNKFAYPKEAIVITKAYAEFGKWAQDQTSNLDWYKTVDNSKVVTQE